MNLDRSGAVHVDHVGRGWAFPLALTAAGGFRLISGGEELDAAIRMILGTAPSERVLRPEFGCEMWSATFAPLTDNTVGLVEQAARDALQRWEPRIDLVSVVAEPDHDHACINLAVTYRIKATNDHRNLVYPFYVIPQEESP